MTLITLATSVSANACRSERVPYPWLLMQTITLSKSTVVSVFVFIFLFLVVAIRLYVTRQVRLAGEFDVLLKHALKHDVRLSPDRTPPDIFRSLDFKKLGDDIHVIEQTLRLGKSFKIDEIWVCSAISEPQRERLHKKYGVIVNVH